MRSLISVFVCMTIAFLLNTSTAHAAFPVPASAEHSVSVKTEKRSFEEFINATVQKYNLPAAPVSDGDIASSGALSITSLALGIGGFAFLVLALAALTWVWLVPAGALGIAAIILGAMGANRRPLRGLGIAGMILGIIDVSILLVVGFFALLFAAFTGQ